MVITLGGLALTSAMFSGGLVGIIQLARAEQARKEAVQSRFHEDLAKARAQIWLTPGLRKDAAIK